MRPNSLRGKLLEFLKHVYPEGADERSIVSVFYQYYKHPDILTSLEYLTDKGYLSRRDLPHPYKPNEKVHLYKIAPSGIDLLDGTTSDPAIAIVPGDG